VVRPGILSVDGVTDRLNNLLFVRSLAHPITKNTHVLSISRRIRSAAKPYCIYQVMFCSIYQNRLEADELVAQYVRASQDTRKWQGIMERLCILAVLLLDLYKMNRFEVRIQALIMVRYRARLPELYQSSSDFM